VHVHATARASAARMSVKSFCTCTPLREHCDQLLRCVVLDVEGQQVAIGRQFALFREIDEVIDAGIAHPRQPGTRVCKVAPPGYRPPASGRESPNSCWAAVGPYAMLAAIQSEEAPVAWRRGTGLDRLDCDVRIGLSIPASFIRYHVK